MYDAAQSLARALRAARRATLVAAVPLVIAAGCATDPPRSSTEAPADVDDASVSAMDSPLAATRTPKMPRFHAGARAGSLLPDALCNNNGATAGFGDGSSGAFAPTASNVFANSDTSVTATAASTTLHVGSTTGFAIDNLVLVHQTQGTNAGTWETARVTAVGASTLTVALPLLASYTTGAQVVAISQFTTVTIPTGVTISAPPWNGVTGGILAFVASGTVTVNGNISADGAGFQGGPGDGGNNACGGPAPKAGFEGESSIGPGARSTNANGQGGGGGGTSATFCCSGCPATPGTTGDSGGGGGGYGTSGVSGEGSAPGGIGGVKIGTADLTTIFLGGGGGGGGGNCGDSSPAGAAGGGIVLISAPRVTVAAAATITARGATAGINSPTNWEGGGGGGAGGAIVVSAATATLSADGIDASGGAGSTQCAGAGGAGGAGLVRVACGTLNAVACPTSAGADVVPTPDVTSFCAFSTCTSAAECATTTPICDTTTRLCVQCLSSSDCATNANGHLCDTTKDTCGTCTSAVGAACTGITPVCDTAGTNDLCAACNGNNGTAATLACPTTTAPDCVTSGPNAGACVQCTSSTGCSGTKPVCSPADACVACNGDNGTTATEACSTSAEPYCNANGSCGKCTSDAECGAGHAGPSCDLATGACGTACTLDAQCGAGNWCDNLTGPGFCQPQTSNGQLIPGGTCTSALGARACISLVCDVHDNECGYKNGDGPCTGADGPTVCRSTLCATSGPNANLCVQCVTSSTCAATTPVCDATSSTCVVCNGDNGTTATDPCSTSAEPYCSGGECGKCTSDAQCGVGHAGPFCNTATGSCGTACFTDLECGAGNWCNNLLAPGVCQPQTTNGLPVPGGTCSATIGARACVSGVCDTDNDCGYKNGDGPCDPADGTKVCRSTICATTGPEAGKCVQCTSSATCSGTTPVCDGTSDGCIACDGDNGTTVKDPCSSSTAPTCNLTTGACAKCTSDAQCGVGHAGPFCNTTTGACGSACSTDAECGAGNWCDNLSGPGICQAQTANGLPVPGGSCAGDGGSVGTRACASGACDPKDNSCGYKNGDGPCDPADGTKVCRSTICATTGPNAGLCEQCVSSTTCTGTTPVCDGTSDSCVACNGDNGTAASDACSSGTEPTCLVTGACGKCTLDSQCGVDHAGPFCDVATGACGSTCFTDLECGGGSWCDNLSPPGVCQLQTPNGHPIPGGTCTPTIAGRACVSGVCTSSGANANDCVQCTSSLQCGGATPVCNTTTNTCVATGGGGGGDAGADAGDGGIIIIGGGDSGSSADGSTESDSGSEEDSGPTTGTDSGSATDSGGGGTDSGSSEDSGASDSGSSEDSGASDSGSSADGGGIDSGADAGIHDAGGDGSVSTNDSGEEEDATSPTDSGSPSDAATLPDGASASSDSGSGTDGSVLEDGGGADLGTIEGGGCSCRTHGARDTGSDGALFAGFAIAMLVQRRRRRARDGERTCVNRRAS